jgi:hypothetical protein
VQLLFIFCSRLNNDETTVPIQGENMPTGKIAGAAKYSRPDVVVAINGRERPPGVARWPLDV